MYVCVYIYIYIDIYRVLFDPNRISVHLTIAIVCLHLFDFCFYIIIVYPILTILIPIIYIYIYIHLLLYTYILVDSNLFIYQSNDRYTLVDSKVEYVHADDGLDAAFLLAHTPLPKGAVAFSSLHIVAGFYTFVL